MLLSYEVKDLRVNVSVGGLWHAPALVKGLLRDGSLGTMYTTRPKFKCPEFMLSMDKRYVKILGHGWIDVTQIVFRKLFNHEFQLEKARLFDELVSRQLSPCDIFVVWSSFGLKSIRKAKALNAKTIVERGSAHIREQDQLLKMVYNKYGIDYRLENGAVDPRIIEREEEEYELADYICVPSTFVYNSFINQGVPKTKLLKIPYGVNTPKLENEVHRDWFASELNILFVGGVSLRKGIPTLLEAYDQVRKYNNIKLTLAGNIDPYMEGFLEPYKEFVTMTGMLNQEKLKELYLQSHILILPSIEEGLARVILEGMGFGLCPVCSTHTGGSDIIKNGLNGFLFEPGDVESLAAILLELAENREMLRKCSSNSLDSVSNYSNEMYEKNIIETYRSILK